MVDFPLHGDELKRIVKKSRAMPIAFGYNFGTMDADDEYFAAHAKKKPEILGKLALTEGAGTKAAFGTFTTLGSEMQLVCFRTLPQMAKKLKKFLKANKIIMNVVVLDPDGNVIDTDVEKLTEWFDEDDDDAVAVEADDETPPSPAEIAAETAPDPAADPAELAARLKALGPAIKAAPADLAPRVQAGFAGAMGLLKAGNLEDAERAISKLELIAARLEHLARTVPPPAPPPPPAAKPETSAPAKAQAAPASPPIDPAVTRRFDAAVDRLAADVAAAGAGAAPLARPLDDARTRIKEGEAEAALGLMRQVQRGLDDLARARGKYDKAASMLEKPVLDALRDRSVGDPDGLRLRWGQAQDLAQAGDHHRALTVVSGIVALLRLAAPVDPQGQGVVAFQRARILWAATRTRMMDEARKLSAAIVAQSADDEDATDIAAAADDIVARVSAIDARLEDVLDRITTAEPAARPPLQAQAAGLVASYQALLGQGIFAVIDDNPFTSVSVTASARAALASIAATLA